jgi:signal transduction histidine kinase
MHPMERSVPHALTIKAALALGFGATLSLWLFAGYYFTQRMAEVQRESRAVNARYMEAQELLSAVRTEVLLGSVYVRDALLDPDPDAVDSYRQHVDETYQTVDSALERYVPILDSAAERSRVEGLRRDIAGFHVALLDVLATDRTQWRTQARLLLSRLMPRRASVMQVSDQIQKLNRGAFVQQQRALADIYASTQDRIWQTLSFALAGSLGIALFATIYVGRLERDLHEQRMRELQTTDDLQRLSTKLVRAQEEERRAIARELHDEVGQVLMAIKVEISLAQRRIEAAAGGPGLLADAQAIADSALMTVRDLSHLLHPAMLDDLGLTAALEWYLSGFGKRHGLAVRLLHDGMEQRLIPEIETAVYRIVQEAMSNIAKHAHATVAFVYLQRAGNVLRVTIEDDGAGFDPSAAPRGLGMIGIRERVAHFDGTASLDTAIGGGMRLLIELPALFRAIPADLGDFNALEPTLSTRKPEVLLG